MNSFSEKLIGNVSKVIVGKDKQIELLLVSLLVGGHVLLEDVPGTGKTTTINAIISFFLKRGYDITLTAPTGRAAK